MKKRICSAQSILEYAVMLSIVAVAMIGMRVYFKRAVQSAIKVAADQIGSQDEGDSVDIIDGVRVVEGFSQNMETLSSGTETEQVSPGGSRNRVFSSTTTVSGSSISVSRSPIKE